MKLYKRTRTIDSFHLQTWCDSSNTVSGMMKVIECRLTAILIITLLAVPHCHAGYFKDIMCSADGLPIAVGAGAVVGAPIVLGMWENEYCLFIYHSNNMI